MAAKVTKKALLVLSFDLSNILFVAHDFNQINLKIILVFSVFLDFVKSIKNYYDI